MKKSIKSLTLGIIIGGMLASGVGYASSVMTKIDVKMEPVKFTYNSKAVMDSDKPNHFYNGKEYIPTSFIYKGTTYVPVRFVGEAVGKQVAWDASARAVAIADMKTDGQNDNSDSDSSTQVKY